MAFSASTRMMPNRNETMNQMTRQIDTNLMFAFQYAEASLISASSWVKDNRYYEFPGLAVIMLAVCRNRVCPCV
jgi:hypothetical protein